MKRPARLFRSPCLGALARSRGLVRLVSIAALATAAAGAAAAPLAVAVIDAAGKAVEGAVVTVSVAGTAGAAAPGTSAQVAQQGRQFVPQVTVVQKGTTIGFPNLDTVRHHVYSFSPAKTFELKLYAGTPAAPVVFDKVGTVVVGCNIHDKMTAWIVVVDTPFFAKTDAAGHARLELPEGEHRLRVWQAQADAAPVERPVHGGEAVSVRLSAAAGA